MPLLQIRNIYSLFCQSSADFSLFLDHSAHFCSLPFTSPFGQSYLRMFQTILVYVTFYWHTISDSRMFIVTISTWSIWNTVSVLWVFWFVVLPLFTKIFLALNELSCKPHLYIFHLSAMDQCTFQFSTRGHCIKGK